MPSRRRRDVLLGVAASVGVAGCAVAPGTTTPGHDSTLHLRNGFESETVELRVEAHRQFVDNGREEDLFFEETVSLEWPETRELEVFTEGDQYRVVVEREDHVVEFNTRPICESASTEVAVRLSGELQYEVEFCDGVTKTGTSDSSGGQSDTSDSSGGQTDTSDSSGG